MRPPRADVPRRYPSPVSLYAGFVDKIDFSFAAASQLQPGKLTKPLIFLVLKSTLC